MDYKVAGHQSSHIVGCLLLFQCILIIPQILTSQNLHADSQTLNPHSCFTFHLCLITGSGRRVATSSEYSALISSLCILQYLHPSITRGQELAYLVFMGQTLVHQ